MIELTHLTKRFGDNVVLNDICTTFPEQETTVILGPSGSGKSTLLRSLNLLEHPEEGQYQIDDLQVNFAEPISSQTTFAVRQKTEMVFQGFNLFPHMTVLKNLIEGPVHVLKKPKADAMAEASTLLKHVGLADKADAYPSQLSGGQAQRVAIARSLAMHPHYILLDEPTSALDPELELEVLKVLLTIHEQQQSMVIVTHNMSFAKRVANKILFIENGDVQYDGSAAGFFASENPRIKRFIDSMSFTI
ncbi:amino acid ABC transporter ATP-binding protein [Furfurilactobacillus siliginis]|uniref:Arginine ABC transporter ATP-binding protein ArtP n=1 Tax=Furfurilactobacillus siliginis TaxID=348151 RepID=A0A0R2LC05_9LACO|nr:amino acid ABC transporter ATP-binding protein [Furfurilactobacillus siliginis]KRN97349.1 polar amino acid ABC transporter ATPase [Furfurilactobacillus siliginis]GEK28977.1 arginine ABC transporter ATP-binding protein ArtP [Furfurilactobacillus siliginis]